MRNLREGLSVQPVESPTLPPATHTNAWILGERRVTIVDPAGISADARAVLGEAVADSTVETIFLTHHHRDHIGGVETLRAATGARVLAHPETASRLPFAVDEIVDEGFVLQTDAGDWEAIHTPGHAPGHLCLIREDGAVVAGDMVAGVGTILLEPSDGGNLRAYLHSLQRLIDAGPDVLLPAHGPEITAAVDYLDSYISHRHQRTRQIQQALAGRGWSEAIALVPTVYAGVPQMFWPMAARQVLCHLLWLAEQGAVERDGDSFRSAG
ncbi:MAG: MBL fold metallo-hydrolase [Myxococcota bacterium]